MKWTKNHTKMMTGIITAITAAIIFLFSQCEVEGADLSVLTGAQYDMHQVTPLIGASLKLSPVMSAFFITSFNTHAQDYELRGALTLRPSPRATIAILLGPQLTTFQPEPDISETMAYLMLSTGIAGIYHVNPTAALFIAYDVLITTQDLPRRTVALGLALRFH